MRYHVHATSSFFLTVMALMAQRVPFKASGYAGLVDYLLANSTEDSIYFAIIPTALSSFLGCIFPDFDLSDNSSLPHRSITHWPWIYLVAAGFALISGSVFLAVFCIGALLHIFLDAFNPHGIPMGLNPFGKRYRFAWIAVGHPIELLISLSFVGLAILVWYLKAFIF